MYKINLNMKAFCRNADNKVTLFYLSERFENHFSLILMLKFINHNNYG